MRAGFSRVLFITNIYRDNRIKLYKTQQLKSRLNDADGKVIHVYNGFARMDTICILSAHPTTFCNSVRPVIFNFCYTRPTCLADRNRCSTNVLSRYWSTGAQCVQCLRAIPRFRVVVNDCPDPICASYKSSQIFHTTHVSYSFRQT